MTATLPPDSAAKLEESGLVTFPRAEHRDELMDLEEQECRPRYRIRPTESSATALARVVEAYRMGRRVLWVVNTVSRCQHVADVLARALGEEPLVYHRPVQAL